MGSFLKSLKSRIHPDDDSADEQDTDTADADARKHDSLSADGGSDRSHQPMRPPDDGGLTDDMEPESVSGSGKQIIDGHLIVDGADMGTVDNSSITDMDDILSIANVKPTIHVPEDVFLPEDMDGIRFDGERDGFSKKQVADFFEKAKASSEYLKKIIEARHDDIYSLAGYAKKLNDQVQDSKMMNEVARASGMAVIAGDDDNKVMELTEENQRLRAQLDNASSGSAADQSSRVQNLQDQLSELKDRYSSIQDQLGREQYTNKQLSDEISEMRLKLDAKAENEHDDIDNLTASISTMGDGGGRPAKPERRQQEPAARQMKPVKPAADDRPHANHRLSPARTASGEQKKRLKPRRASLRSSKDSEPKRQPVSLKPSGAVKMAHAKTADRKNTADGDNANVRNNARPAPQKPQRQEKPKQAGPGTDKHADSVRSSSDPTEEDSRYISFD